MYTLALESALLGKEVNGNQLWVTKVRPRKALLTPRHPLHAFSEPRPGRILEKVEASKTWLPIVLVVVYLKYTTEQGGWVSETVLAATFD